MLGLSLGALPTLVAFVLLAVSPTFATQLHALLTKPALLAYKGTADTGRGVVVATRGRGADDASTVDVRLSLRGDPGIYITATCAVSTVLAMLDMLRAGGGAEGMPAGFHTPAVAVGAALAKRLRMAPGVVFECV